MPAFIKSTKDNKKLYGKTAFCLKIYLKLMDVGYRHIAIKLTEQIAPKRKFCSFFSTEFHYYRFFMFLNLIEVWWILF
ncbi:hypothetical protein ABE03_02325 [Bacillus thuringiensis]|nr:hypothetical protein [Bacillus thuringiensis]